VRDDSADVDPRTFKGYEWQRTDGDRGLIRRLIEWSRTYFRQDCEPDQIDARDNLAHRLELGDIALLGLPYESYQAAFNEALLDQIYEGRWQEIDLEAEGGYHEEATTGGYRRAGKLLILTSFLSSKRPPTPSAT